MRKTITVTAQDGRDAGKAFLITEMPARQAEKWAARAFLALAKSGADVPDDLAASGIVGLATVGLKMFGGMSFADAEPLMDEMAQCWRLVPDPNRPDITRPLQPNGDDIEEVRTYLRLRRETLELHVGFKLADVRSRSAQASAAAAITSNTQTSPVA